MASTIIRVKRRLEDEPVEAVLLSFKRRKTGENPAEEEQALLRFTGTLPQKDDEAATKAVHIFKTKKELEDSFKVHNTDISAKQRNEKLMKRKESRFKILSFNRSVDTVEDDERKAVTIVDVDAEMDEAEVANVEVEVRAEPKYVYDLYSSDFLGDNGDIDDSYFETLVSVQPFTTELQYRGSEDSEEIDPYDEDSNDEGNWRNDYPDSDHSINEDDMRLAASLQGMGIDNGVDLSSDSEDERYLAMTGESPPKGYDAYKAKILKGWSKSNFVDHISGSDDDDDDDNFESADDED